MSQKNDYISLMLEDTFSPDLVGVTLDIKLARNELKKCYKFNLDGKSIEIPMGWAFFSDFNGHELMVDKFKDKLFIEVLSNYCGKEIMSIRFEVIADMENEPPCLPLAA